MIGCFCRVGLEGGQFKRPLSSEGFCTMWYNQHGISLCMKPNTGLPMWFIIPYAAYLSWEHSLYSSSMRNNWAIQAYVNVKSNLGELMQWNQTAVRQSTKSSFLSNQDVLPRWTCDVLWLSGKNKSSVAHEGGDPSFWPLSIRLKYTAFPMSHYHNIASLPIGNHVTPNFVILIFFWEIKGFSVSSWVGQHYFLRINCSKSHWVFWKKKKKFSWKPFEIVFSDGR